MEAYKQMLVASCDGFQIKLNLGTVRNDRSFYWENLILQTYFIYLICLEQSASAAI